MGACRGGGGEEKGQIFVTSFMNAPLPVSAELRVELRVLAG